jgi:hypothetical protein
MVASKRYEDLYWFRPEPSLRNDGVCVPRLNALKFLQWGGARMIEEEKKLELGDGQLEGKLQEPCYDGECMNE